MRWHYKEIEKRKGVRYNDCRSVTNPPTKNRKVSLLGTGGTFSTLIYMGVEFFVYGSTKRIKLSCILLYRTALY